MSKLEKELMLFEQDLKKNAKEIENHKRKIINELKGFDKQSFFEQKKKRPKSFFDKILDFFNGKKL